MFLDRREDLDRGLRLVQELGEVMPQQADEQVRAVYEDVKATLRVPFVNFVFRTLANYPGYLGAAWSRARSQARLLAFERAADDLRRHALLEQVPDASDVDWAALGDLGRIRAFTDTIAYVLPKLLLLATAFDEALRAATAPAARLARLDAGRPAEVPLGVADGTVTIPMVDPQAAAGELKALFEDIRARHVHPRVASYFRALGHWPGFLAAAWDRIAPLVGTAAYNARKQILVARASETLRSMPRAAEATGAAEVFAVEETQRGELSAMLALFRFRIIPDLLLDVAMITAMLEGKEAARRSHFSVR